MRGVLGVRGPPGDSGPGRLERAASQSKGMDSDRDGEESGEAITFDLRGVRGERGDSLDVLEPDCR